jgi:hypothetical protein
MNSYVILNVGKMPRMENNKMTNKFMYNTTRDLLNKVLSELGGIYPKSDITVSDLVEVADFVDFLNGEARYMLFDKFSTKEDFFHDYIKCKFLNERTRDCFSHGKEILPNGFKIDGSQDLQGCEFLEPDKLISDFADWINNVRDIYISEETMLLMADLALNDLYEAITSEMIDFFGVEEN